MGDQKRGPTVYSPHGVLLNGPVFHEWVWLLIINIPHYYMEAVGAYPPGPEGAGVPAILCLASSIYLTLSFLPPSYLNFCFKSYFML